MIIDRSEKLSCYILTNNSERYLTSVITPIRELIDDLLIVDSGSSDRTREIAEQLKARFVTRELDNFVDQRTFALQACEHRWTLSLDSDEVPDETFAESLAELKANSFFVGDKQPDAFRIKRRWFVLGQEIHAFYPITSPDYPIRLFRKDKVGFTQNARRVHETPEGFNHLHTMDGSVIHYSCDSITELYEKLNLYTSLAAGDLHKRGVQGSWLDILTHPMFACLKWYIGKGGWKDGRIGLLLAHYAYDYTYQKYLKLRYDFKML